MMPTANHFQVFLRDATLTGSRKKSKLLFKKEKPKKKYYGVKNKILF